MKNGIETKFSNILLLSIEDLNDWIEPLGGHPQSFTPNLTRLAERAAVFTNAFAAAPACSPSRTAALFGKAPWKTGIYSNRQSWAMHFLPGERQSIVGRARDAGWETIGAGKVFHTGSSGFDVEDWSQYFFEPTDAFTPISRVVKNELLGSNDDFGAIPDSAPPLLDDRAVARISKTMIRGATRKFWAFGSYRPHLPFIVPQRFFDLIKRPIQLPPGLGGKEFDPREDSEIADLPDQAKKIIMRRTGRMLYRTGEYKRFVHAYLASIAYADDIIGRLLDKLDTEGLTDNTLVVFWSDHGWQLGEKLCFRKFTLWDRALRVPLFIAGNGVPVGQVTTPVSLLDIYPTLLAAMKLEKQDDLDGQNLFPLTKGARGKAHVVSMWERFNRTERRSYLATSVRSENYRLIQYSDGGLELYDHSIDPFEKNNLLHQLDKWEGTNLEPIMNALQAHYPQTIARAKNLKSLPADLNTRKPKIDGVVKIT